MITSRGLVAGQASPTLTSCYLMGREEESSCDAPRKRRVRPGGTFPLVRQFIQGFCTYSRRTTQAIGQQHTSPLRAGCEAREDGRFKVFFRFDCTGIKYDQPSAESDLLRLAAGNDDRVLPSVWNPWRRPTHGAHRQAVCAPCPKPRCVVRRPEAAVM